MAKIEYKYGLRNRPPGPGATPRDAIAYQRKHPRFRHGVLYFERQLTQDEIYGYELTPILDTPEQKAEAVKHIIEQMAGYQQQYAAPENNDLLVNFVGRELDKIGYADLDDLIELVRVAL